MAYQTVNPYDNQIVATFDDLTDEQAMDLLAQAQKTFESWSQTSFAERAAVCGRAAAIFRERSDEFARLLTLKWASSTPRLWAKSSSAPRSWTTTPRTPRPFLAPEPPQPPAPMTRHAGQRPAGSHPGGTALELPVLPAGAGGSPQPDGRQRGHGQTRLQRAAGGGRLREAAAGGRRTRRRLHQPVRHQGSDQPADRRPARSRRGADRQRGRRRGRGRPRGQEPQEVHPGTRRVGRIHRAGRLPTWTRPSSGRCTAAFSTAGSAVWPPSGSSSSTRSPTSSWRSSRWRCPS